MPDLPEDALPHWELAKNTISSTLTSASKSPVPDSPYIWAKALVSNARSYNSSLTAQAKPDTSKSSRLL